MFLLDGCETLASGQWSPATITSLSLTKGPLVSLEVQHDIELLHYTSCQAGMSGTAISLLWAGNGNDFYVPRERDKIGKGNLMDFCLKYLLF